ncbi:tail fiber protein [Eikenella sp. NML03-A-027]|uniref:tail fiber protein n=1 Tax=Eikenella sp. NML03-A-027 TaxID=1795828 RepID=UPI00350F2C99
MAFLLDEFGKNASTTQAGIVQLSSATNSDREDMAATSKAVKTAYDKAEEAVRKSLPLGSIVAFPRVVTNPVGFLKADGSTFAQATYPDLYRVLGGNKLPNLTRSDIGMTAYFPFGDIPDGWIKYDEIAAKVTQSAYPELYRKLVAQYGSIADVKPVDDYFVRNVGSGGQIGKRYPWAVGDHHHVLGIVAYGNDDLLLKRLPVDKYYPNQVKAGDPMITIYGILGGSEGQNPSSKVFESAHEQAAEGKYSQKHAVPITYDHAYTDQYTPKPYYQDNTPKYVGMVLCIKAKDSLDDIVFWIKAYGKVTNAGALDASTLAAQLQDKADKNHTHRAADISDLGEAVRRQMADAMQHQAGANGYTKLPNGLIDQWGFVPMGWQGEGPVKVTFPIAFPNECYNVQITVKSGGSSGAVGTDITIGAGDLTATGFNALVNTWGQGANAADFQGFFFRAIGR